MSRTTWTIQTKPAGSWVAGGTIYRPNENLSIQKASTQSAVPLADGSMAYITPSTKYLDRTLVFVWLYLDGTMKTQVEGYVNNQTNVKIIDHLSYEYIGRFVSSECVHLVEEEPDMYNIRANFEVMPGLA